MILVICGITSSVLVLFVLNILAIHHFQTLIGFASYNICLLEELPGSDFF